eukprot:2491887-Rhodomonas_salina.1
MTRPPTIIIAAIHTAMFIVAQLPSSHPASLTSALPLPQWCTKLEGALEAFGSTSGRMPCFAPRIPCVCSLLFERHAHPPGTRSLGPDQRCAPLPRLRCGLEAFARGRRHLRVDLVLLPRRARGQGEGGARQVPDHHRHRRASGQQRGHQEQQQQLGEREREEASKGAREQRGGAQWRPER